MVEELLMGIDPGLGTTGWGIVRVSGKGFSYVDSGKLHTTPAQPMGERLRKLFDELQAVARNHKIVACAVESGYVGKGPQSALKLGQARAAAILAIETMGIRVEDLAPREIKMALTGRGSAAKEQVGYVVGKILSLEFESNEQDISDALAAALCCAMHRQRSPRKATV
jgi:crossover junction endodeoxyribonuclease RuvC